MKLLFLVIVSFLIFFIHFSFSAPCASCATCSENLGQCSHFNLSLSFGVVQSHRKTGDVTFMIYKAGGKHDLSIIILL